MLSDGFSIKLFIAKPYSQHLNFKKEELLEYKHNSWIFYIAPKAYIYYSYKLMFFFSLGALKVYLMYQEKKSLQLSWRQQLHQHLTKLSSLLANNLVDFQNCIYLHLEAWMYTYN